MVCYSCWVLIRVVLTNYWVRQLSIAPNDYAVLVQWCPVENEWSLFACLCTHFWVVLKMEIDTLNSELPTFFLLAISSDNFLWWEKWLHLSLLFHVHFDSIHSFPLSRLFSSFLTQACQFPSLFVLVSSLLSHLVFRCSP